MAWFGETLSWRTRFVVTSASSKLLHLFKSTICVWSSDSWWQHQKSGTTLRLSSWSSYFQGFIHPWWLFGISEPWTVSSHPLGFFLIQEPSGFHKPSSPRGRLEFGSEPAKLKVWTVELIAPPFILKNCPGVYIYISIHFFFCILLGGWTTRLKNMLVKMGIFPKFRGENTKYLKPPPSFFYTYKMCIYNYTITVATATGWQ